MKKVIYDTKEIMRRAWKCVKKHGMSLADALKWSWKIAKKEAEEFIRSQKAELANKAERVELKIVEMLGRIGRLERRVILSDGSKAKLRLNSKKVVGDTVTVNIVNMRVEA
jgi:predicted nucleic acid-binding protein